MSLLPLAMIAAMTPRRAIGRAGALPWHVPEDLKQFREKTTGHAVIIGRKTFDTMGKALPKRRNIVVSRKPVELPPGVERCASVEEAIALARTSDPCPFVLGGGEIYVLAMPLATDLYLTLIEGPDDTGADAFFPPIDESAFEVVTRAAGATPGVTFLHYRRRTGAPASPAF